MAGLRLRLWSLHLGFFAYSYRRIIVRRDYNYAAGRTSAGWTVPSQMLSMLPYIATIVVLVVIARNRDFALANSPACLGRLFISNK